MAEQQRNQLLFKNPYAQLANVLPEQAAEADRMAAAYQGAYNNRNFGTEHPIVTGLLGLLSGGGVPGAINAVVGSRQADQQRQAQIAGGWQQWANQQLINQGNLDKIAAPRNEVMSDQALQDRAKQLGLVSQDVPNLYEQNLAPINPDGSIGQAPPTNIPVLSREYLENRRKGVFGASDINAQRNINLATAADNYRLPSGVGMPGANNAQPGTLQGNVSQNSYSPTPVDLPFYIANPEKIMEGITSTGNNALTQGQERYKFDQEAPVRAADVANKQADTKLKQTDLKSRDALNQALIEQRRYHPPVFGPQPSWQEKLYGMMTPEQQAQFRANASAPNGGSDSTGYSKGEQQQYNLLKDQAVLAKQIYGENSKEAKGALQQLSKFDLRGQVGGDMSNVRRPAKAAYKPSPKLPSKGGFTTSGGIKVQGL